MTSSATSNPSQFASMCHYLFNRVVCELPFLDNRLTFSTSSREKYSSGSVLAKAGMAFWPYMMMTCVRRCRAFVTKSGSFISREQMTQHHQILREHPCRSGLKPHRIQHHWLFPVGSHQSTKNGQNSSADGFRFNFSRTV